MRKPNEIILKNGKTLEKVLEEHKHWLCEDCDGWEKMEADLSYADLRNADLSKIDLSKIDLRYANLRYADLSNADLRYDNLSNADLRYANLRNANLRCADLRYASLRCADLRYAELREADLREADLREAELRNAKNIPFIPYSCPDVGSFIGYKKAKDGIVELEILSDARRCSATGRKCRCDKAKVLGIYDNKHNMLDIKKTVSDYNECFIYQVGEIVEEPNFNEDRWNECSEGIHFFINFQEAVNY